MTTCERTNERRRALARRGRARSYYRLRYLFPRARFGARVRFSLLSIRNFAYSYSTLWVFSLNRMSAPCLSGTPHCLRVPRLPRSTSLPRTRPRPRATTRCPPSPPSARPSSSRPGRRLPSPAGPPRRFRCARARRRRVGDTLADYSPMRIAVVCFIATTRASRRVASSDHRASSAVGRAAAVALARAHAVSVSVSDADGPVHP